MLLNKDQTLLVIVDVQGKLARIVAESETMIANLEKLIQGVQLLNIPIIWLEQYPQGLGRTVPEIKQHLASLKPIEKVTFSANDNEQFVDELAKHNRNQLLITGIEAHICVYQTVAHLLAQDYEVNVVEDAISSRTIDNKRAGLEKMVSLGATKTTVEMALYEMLRSADSPYFKGVLEIIK